MDGSVKSISAPDADIDFYLWLRNGQPFYRITFSGKEIVQASRLGLVTDSDIIGDLSQGFADIRDISESSGDTTWEPIAGEKDVIKNKYNAKVFGLTKQGDAPSLSIEVRAYNTGAAFRYLLPDAATNGDYKITDEQTRFVFSPDGDGLYHTSAQSAASKSAISSLPTGNIYPPFTAVFNDGTAATLTLANVENYSFNLLHTDAEGRIKAHAFTVDVNAEGPFASPYWTFVVGASLKELPLNKDIILNLNDAPDEKKYGFGDWVKPGKALMMGLFSETTFSIKEKIDLAKELGLAYILMDFGWYGPEFYRYSDPRLDPTKLVDDPADSEVLAAAKAYMRQYVTEDGVFNALGKQFNVYLDSPLGGDIRMEPCINVTEIINYSNSKGVGIFLYVNDVQLHDGLGRFTVDELFEQFAKWGVKGVKPGFVANKSQAGERSTRELIEIAARHRLMLTIHDDWLQSGIERKYPNLLSVEGVFGDEGLSTSDIEGDLNALFSRGIQGFADHTVCYPGKAARGYQLAESVLWPTALNCVYWPWRNTDTGNQAMIESLPEREKDFWRNMPATWDELIILEAEVSKSAATARRSGDRWYLGAISAVGQKMELPLSFLCDGMKYVVDLYLDKHGNDANNSNRNNTGESAELLVASYIVDSGSVLSQYMAYGTGIAAILRPAKKEDENIPAYGE